MPEATFAGPRTRGEVRIGVRPHAALPWLLLPPGVASQLVAQAEVAPLPNVRRWCTGVLSLRGNLTPVFDFGQWLGHAGLGAGAGVLVIAPGPQAVGLLCCEQPQVLEATPSRTPPPPALQGHVGAAFACEHGTAFEFDALAWLSSVARDVPGRLQ